MVAGVVVGGTCYKLKINIRVYELYELYYRITQITGKPVFYIVVQKYI